MQKEYGRRDSALAKQRMNSARAVVENYLVSGRGVLKGKMDRRLPGAIALVTGRTEMGVRRDLRSGKTPAQLLAEVAEKRDFAGRTAV